MNIYVKAMFLWTTSKNCTGNYFQWSGSFQFAVWTTNRMCILVSGTLGYRILGGIFLLYKSMMKLPKKKIFWCTFQKSHSVSEILWIIHAKKYDISSQRMRCDILSRSQRSQNKDGDSWECQSERSNRKKIYFFLREHYIQET